MLQARSYSLSLSLSSFSLCLMFVLCRGPSTTNVCGPIGSCRSPTDLYIALFLFYMYAKFEWSKIDHWRVCKARLTGVFVKNLSLELNMMHLATCTVLPVLRCAQFTMVLRAMGTPSTPSWFSDTPPPLHLVLYTENWHATWFSARVSFVRCCVDCQLASANWLCYNWLVVLLCCITIGWLCCF